MGNEMWAKGYESAVLTMKAMLRGRIEAYPVPQEHEEARVQAFRDILVDVQCLETVAKSLRESA